MKSVIFMGTPDFAVPALKSLIDSPKYDVKLVISQPDKPQGRKQILTASPVKQLALQHSIQVYQPETLKTDEVYEYLKQFTPDFIVVSAYGKILPERILKLPVYGCVNLHGSLLPAYRGAAPIQWSVINGDKKTGVTTMLMDAGLDTGDILMTSEKLISDNETAGEVFDALASLCPELLMLTLEGLENNTIKPVKQDSGKASYVSVLSKDMAVINWNKDAKTIHNLVRGMNPWPVARTFMNGKILKVFSTEVLQKLVDKIPGTVFVESGNIYVVCGNSTVLKLNEIQLEGSKRMAAEDFLRGHSFNEGFSFLAEV